MKDKQAEGGQWPTTAIPETWDWIPFNEAFHDATSSRKKLPLREYAAAGKFPVVDQGQDAVGGLTDRSDLLHDAEPPVVVFGDHTRCVKLVETSFVQGADGVKVLKPRGCLDTRFAYHALRAVRLPDKGYSRHFKFLRATPIPRAPLPEQRRIVTKIEALQERSDAAKAALDAVPPLLEKFRQSVLAAAFRGDLTKQWRAEHPDVEPASVLLELIRAERKARFIEDAAEKVRARAEAKVRKAGKPWTAEDDGKALAKGRAQAERKYEPPEPVDPTGLPELPEGWCWASLDEVVENHDGSRIPVKRSDRAKRQGDYPYYGASGQIDSIDGYLFDGSYLLVAEDGANLLSRSTPIAFKADGRFWVNNHAHVLQTLAGVPLGYVESYLNGMSLRQFVTGTAQPKLTRKAMDRIPVPLAPVSEAVEIVRRIAGQLDATESIASNSSESVQRLSRMDQAILARAFRGELVGSGDTGASGDAPG